ncbi:MAG: 2-dehydro-3-deoxyglucarate aldolase [uncultured bacterium]|nr:MAG: 2-dehydro-3-deoxyglucarate aldolase [uncultured bacterium]
MLINKFRQRVKNGENVIGPWCSLASSTITDIIASAGMDFVILDMEHGNINYNELENMIRAAILKSCCPIVRVGMVDELQILKPLDLGAQGIIAAHVETKEDCEKLVSYVKYYPQGKRGFSSFTPAGEYSLTKVRSHSDESNKETITGIIIESLKGIENLDSITDTKHLDLVYIGAYDLAQSMGFPGNPSHPDVQNIIKDSIKKIRNKGLIAGGYAAKNHSEIKPMLDMGMQFITYIPDVTVIFHAFNDIKIAFDKLK